MSQALLPDRTLTHDNATPDVARIVLGGRFGEEDERLSFARLARFVEYGGRLVDTAHTYADGRSEEIVGRWLRDHPGAIGVADKIGHPDVHGGLDLSRERLRREVELSLRRLGVSRLDMLLLHRDDPRWPVEALMETLFGLRSRGYAVRVGVSNWAPRRLDEAASMAQQAGIGLVASYQFSLAVPDRPLWPGTLSACQAIMQTVRRHRMPLLAWAGQARGFFTGRSEPVGDPPRDPFDCAENRRMRWRCGDVGRRLGVKAEAVALAWSLHVPGVIPVIGPRTVAELDVSLGAANVSLDPATRAWLSSGRWL